MAKWGEIKCERCAGLEERLEAAQRDAKEAEAYAEELEAKLSKCEAALREYLMPTTEPDDDGIPLLRAALDEITGGEDE